MESTISPVSDQLLLTKRGRVWITCDNPNYTYLDVPNWRELRAALDTCRAGSVNATINGKPTARETWHLVDPSGVLYTLGSEHGYLFSDRAHGVPIHFLNLMRAYPERVLVHVTPA